jgi:putative ABC transport system permease protein
MFKNYFKIAVRNLIRHKTFSFINIAGLALGIAGSLLMFVYVINELSYENFHQNKDQICRVAIQFGQSESSMKLAGVMPALGPALVEELPEVLNAVRFIRDTKATIEYGEKEFREQRFFFADPSVFDVFTFPLLGGEPKEVLKDPFHIVISEAMAYKYFGSEQAVGKLLRYKDQYEFQVSGIMKNIPANTHLKCDFIASYSSLETIAKVEQPWNQFGQDYTYLLLQDDFSSSNLKEKIMFILQKNTNEQFASMFLFYIQPLDDIYLTSKMMGELDRTGNVTYVYLFSSLAILVLLIACLNFMNLSTARSFHRVKEIGLRKVLGAKRLQLVKQFLGEALIVTAIALVFSLLLFELFFPSLNRFLETKLVVDYYHNLNFYLILIGIIVFVGLVAGLYPALFLSRYKPVDSLKGGFNYGSGSSVFRKSLVVIQFMISIFLIIGTFIVYNQLHFMRETDLGFNKENVVLISFHGSAQDMDNKYLALKNEFSKNSQVISVAGANMVPGLHNKEQQGIRLKDMQPDEMIMARFISIDYEYVQTLGLEIKQGRNFSEAFSTDASSSIIINEKAAKSFNLADPVGYEIILPSRTGEIRLLKVIGVVKDFHIESLHNNIEPILLYINPNRFYTIALRIQPTNTQQTIQYLESVWKKLIPGQSFNYTFLDDTYNMLYNSEEKAGQMVTIFSFLAIYIACMGLFGLAAFTAEQRTKEIGVRKVLGASVSNIVQLLSKEFVKWVILANIIAWPLAWFVLNKWLENFAYRIDVSWWVFFLSGAIALFIALFTVSTQAIKAAIANPVDALKYE